MLLLLRLWSPSVSSLGFILTSYDLLFTVIIIGLASLVIVRHKDNIKRIQNKTENLIPWGLNLTHQEPKK